jgi:hypothetical protein
MPAHYIGREPGVLDIFFEFSLKIPRIYSNMLEYARICSNMLEYARICSNILDIYLSGKRGGLTGEAGRRAVRAGEWAGGRAGA